MASRYFAESETKHLSVEMCLSRAPVGSLLPWIVFQSWTQLSSLLLAGQCPAWPDTCLMNIRLVCRLSRMNYYLLPTVFAWQKLHLNWARRHSQLRTWSAVCLFVQYVLYKLTMWVEFVWNIFSMFSVLYHCLKIVVKFVEFIRRIFTNFICLIAMWRPVTGRECI